MAKMNESLSEEEHAKARETMMMHVRKVVPNALSIVVATGIYMFTQVFGEITD